MKEVWYIVRDQWKTGYPSYAIRHKDRYNGVSRYSWTDERSEATRFGTSLSALHAMNMGFNLTQRECMDILCVKEE